MLDYNNYIYLVNESREGLNQILFRVSGIRLSAEPDNYDANIYVLEGYYDDRVPCICAVEENTEGDWVVQRCLFELPTIPMPEEIEELAYDLVDEEEYNNAQVFAKYMSAEDLVVWRIKRFKYYYDEIVRLNP